jgi:hypothetical protein
LQPLLLQKIFIKTQGNKTIATMKREDIVHFGAGPASLPSEVLATAAAALQNYDDTGL